MVTETYVRLLALSGCANFRDLGGYETHDGRKTRWRVLFRSDALHQLTPDDVSMLATLDRPVVSGLDLRSALELTNTGPGLVYENSPRHHHLPLLQEIRTEAKLETSVWENYLRYTETAQACFAGLFGKLADAESLPAVFYCAAGKDRTGIVAAMILRVLGVSDEQIIEDYALTRPMAPEVREARMRELGWSGPVDPQLFLALPETMERFLHGIDERHGSAEAYLETCGVTAAQLASVREHLLQP